MLIAEKKKLIQHRMKEKDKIQMTASLAELYFDAHNLHGIIFCKWT